MSGKSPTLKYWHCPNCGQVHFAEAPPDMCDVCEDFTTWMQYPPHEGKTAFLDRAETASGQLLLDMIDEEDDDPPTQPALFDL